ncbi:ribonuclease Y [Candidatus Kaiserbacteria bacterium RIFCSPLOWO2_02_FULL_55_12]|uniref:Ribonuclease Y n=2 Tax=Candidatus Kaiseribacteriota TaxID=1752734 RepID=A0A1F6F196_9BACT|nr:MAG: ribonuclease Y [Candidatus Kaiserbacteria bacterium RIFCSPHIGHO2_02_FULL_55_17]OGG79644.1 MAG: ribonuclease Y [Candidatus Kaiserbacteria bacterium RIFCSPLOWO2_02_FULL_55_12]
MSLKIILIMLALSGVGGVILGYVLRVLIGLAQRGSIELDIKQKLLQAKEQAAKIIADAEFRGEVVETERLAPVEEREEKISLREERLASREEFLDSRQRDLDDKEVEVRAREQQALHAKLEADKLSAERSKELAKIANLSETAAREELFREIERAYEEAILLRLQKLAANGRERLEDKARAILTAAIHRLGNAVNAEVMSLSVALPSDEMKGKIIGKEGRNIKAFERATGVDILIDDVPDRITLSSFDPLRRAIAKIALEKLIIDGRIQPTKIEEAVEKTRAEVADIVKQKGEAAAYEAGVIGLDPKLIALLGRLHFRTSYGQNVLQHSIEMAHLASMLAVELGADQMVARTAALLHDIGKAVDHEVQGTHVEIGRRILEKFGVDKRIIVAMQSHHDEHPYETPESVIVQVADAISAGRPGARRDTVDRYLERLGDLERLAHTFPGVEKVYAISAGREIRIFVNPGKVTDLAMHTLARNIAKRIQEEIKYPGEIKVNIIRENRVVEFAR